MCSCIPTVDILHVLFCPTSIPFVCARVLARVSVSLCLCLCVRTCMHTSVHMYVCVCCEDANKRVTVALMESYLPSLTSNDELALMESDDFTFCT